MKQLDELDERVVGLVLVEVDLGLNHAIVGVFDFVENVVVMFSQVVLERIVILLC